MLEFVNDDDDGDDNCDVMNIVHVGRTKKE